MNRGNIMVIEDDRTVLWIIQNTLTRAGYTLSAVANTGLDALNKVAETHPDLILIDFMLYGDIDGIETGSYIVTNYNLPIIYLLNFTETNQIKRACLTNPYGYLIKPFDEIQLLSILALGLNRRKKEKLFKEENYCFSSPLSYRM